MNTSIDDTAVRERLQSERNSLQEQLDAFPVEHQGNQNDDYGVSQHPADDATELFIRERNIPLRSNLEDQIVQIDTALERLDAGSYGQCARCGRPINPERLEALPAAIYCIDCQRAVEHESS